MRNYTYLKHLCSGDETKVRRRGRKKKGRRIRKTEKSREIGRATRMGGITKTRKTSKRGRGRGIETADGGGGSFEAADGGGRSFEAENGRGKGFKTADRAARTDGKSKVLFTRFCYWNDVQKTIILN